MKYKLDITMLEAIQLCSRKGGITLFENLSFMLHPGEILHIKGENGSGKSTLLKIISGTSQPTVGEVHWDRQNIHDSELFKSCICYIGHKHGLKENLTVSENLRLLAALKGNYQINIYKTLTLMQLQHLADQPTNTLSAGQKQRLSLVRLLISNAKLWLLDEPLTALDQAMVNFVKQLMQNHLHEKGMIIYSSHQDLAFTNNYKNLHLLRRET